MLTIYGKNSDEKFCDGFSRRAFLRIGGLSLGGLAMPDIMKAEALAPKPVASGGLGHKAVIMIFLPGGPPHQDMWDIKTDAPTEIRGEFNPIKTNVPGIEICEMFPRLAKISDKLVYIRSIVGAAGGHDAVQCLTGYSPRDQTPGARPCLGSVLAKIKGTVNDNMPPFVGMSPPMGHRPWADNGQPGFLGPAYAPFRPNGSGSEDLTLNGITLDRLRDRKALLTSFDNFRRDADNSGLMSGLDVFSEQAFGVLTSSHLANALDLEKEDPKIRNRYGRGSAKKMADGGPRLMDHFLTARRLVEAGVRCVTVGFSRWDWHGNNFGRARQDMPMLDQGVSALVEDLHSRGLDKDVSVIVWGEFGRTPNINKDGGRDHWPKVSCALMAGGGMKTGQVIGSTTKDGGEAKDRPVHFQEVFATLYNNLGIDPETTLITDLTGRPRHLVEPKYKLMREVV